MPWKKIFKSIWSNISREHIWFLEMKRQYSIEQKNLKNWMNNLAIHGVIWSKLGINGLLNQKEFNPGRVVRGSLSKVNQKLEAEIIKKTASVIQLLDSVQSAVSELCVFLQIAAFSSRYNLTRPKLIPSQESRPQGLFRSFFISHGTSW